MERLVYYVEGCSLLISILTSSMILDTTINRIKIMNSRGELSRVKVLVYISFLCIVYFLLFIISYTLSKLIYNDLEKIYFYIWYSVIVMLSIINNNIEEVSLDGQ